MIKTVWCVTFYVSDLRRAVKFYEEILGLEKKYEYSSYAGFECGGVEVGLIPKLEECKHVASKSPSVEFLVENVERFYEELKGKGVKFIRELHEEPWGGKQATFTDPDGNILEIVQIDWEKYFNVSAQGAKKRA
ncbi:MAG: VOC family protein [Candidatus Brockarchaeota archaeon]|nr:VOC family protein [Candidatus Brockarchaeota archaeon]